MTDEQIIQLAQQHLEEEWCEEDGEGWVEFAGTPQRLIEFARLIYQTGFDSGMESYAEGQYLCSSYPQ